MRLRWNSSIIFSTMVRGPVFRLGGSDGVELRDGKGVAGESY